MNSGKSANKGKRDAGRFALIIVQAQRKQETYAGAEYNAGPGNENNVWNGNLRLHHFLPPYLQELEWLVISMRGNHDGELEVRLMI